MTLRLLKSLRITRRNTRPASESVFRFCIALRCRESPASRRRRASCLSSRPGASSAVCRRADEPTDPISKLGQRSALQRWKERGRSGRVRRRGRNDDSSSEQARRSTARFLPMSRHRTVHCRSRRSRRRSGASRSHRPDTGPDRVVSPNPRCLSRRREQ